jgi:hypothetical protein
LKSMLANPTVRRWLPTVVGLATIPLIIHPIDECECTPAVEPSLRHALPPDNRCPLIARAFIPFPCHAWPFCSCASANGSHRAQVARPSDALCVALKFRPQGLQAA